MRATVFIVFLAFCYIECRKAYQPIDKKANLDFINMETGGYGGGNRPAVQPASPVPVQPAPAPKSPTPAPTPVPTVKPTVVTPTTPVPTPSKPAQPVQPQPTKPAPVNPAPAAHPTTTPLPGSVKHLINFYDGQGKGSPIRPYSYSQAVKQG